MKRKLKMNIKIFITAVLAVLSITGCEYKEIADADYPDQRIYLPAAAGIFSIKTVPAEVGQVPTPGSPYKFKLDIPNNTFTVPLGVVRSGIDLNGKVTVEISLSNDTVATLISKGTIEASAGILPKESYTMQPSAVIESGRESALFNINIDLEYLKSFPDTLFAVCVKIASADRVVNPLLSKAVILIYTKILTPKANFTITPNAADKSKYTFVNTSENAVSFKWDFGDGSEPDSTNKSPVHYYAKSKSYIVTLISKGILGEVNPSKKQSVVKVVLKPKADFSYAADAADAKKIIFTNKSVFAVTYSWDFGDGSALSEEKDPVHTYAAAGSFTVKLTVIGDTGEKVVKSLVVKVL